MRDRWLTIAVRGTGRSGIPIPSLFILILRFSGRGWLRVIFGLFAFTAVRATLDKKLWVLSWVLRPAFRSFRFKAAH